MAQEPVMMTRDAFSLEDEIEIAAEDLGRDATPQEIFDLADNRVDVAWLEYLYGIGNATPTSEGRWRLNIDLFRPKDGSWHVHGYVLGMSGDTIRLSDDNNRLVQVSVHDIQAVSRSFSNWK